MPIRITIDPATDYTQQELALIFKGGDPSARAVYKIATLRKHGLRAHGIYYRGENVLDAIDRLRHTTIARGSALAGKEEQTRERKTTKTPLLDNSEAQNERLHAVRNPEGMGNLLARFERKVSQVQTAVPEPGGSNI